MTFTHPLLLAASEILKARAHERWEAIEADRPWGSWAPLTRSALVHELVQQNPRRKRTTVETAVDALIALPSFNRDVQAQLTGVPSPHSYIVGNQSATYRRFFPLILDTEYSPALHGPKTRKLAYCLGMLKQGVSPLTRPMNITLYNQAMEDYSRECRVHAECRAALPSMVAELALDFPEVANLLAQSDAGAALRALAQVRVEAGMPIP